MGAKLRAEQVGIIPAVGADLEHILEPIEVAAPRAARRALCPRARRHNAASAGNWESALTLKKDVETWIPQGRQAPLAVQRFSLVNRCTGNCTVGSNPTLSASLIATSMAYE